METDVKKADCGEWQSYVEYLCVAGDAVMLGVEKVVETEQT